MAEKKLSSPNYFLQLLTECDFIKVHVLLVLLWLSRGLLCHYKFVIIGLGVAASAGSGEQE